MCCAYCARRATMKVPCVPEDVCDEHGREFWTGLLAYAIDRITDVKQARWRVIDSGEGTNQAYLRARAIAAAGPPPCDRLEDLTMRLAS